MLLYNTHAIVQTFLLILIFRSLLPIILLITISILRTKVDPHPPREIRRNPSKGLY